MNIRQIKKSIDQIMEIRSKALQLNERLRRAEDHYAEGRKELEAVQSLLTGQVLDLAGHCTSYLYLMQQQEENSKSQETAA